MMKSTLIASLALVLATQPLIASDRQGMGRGMDRPEFTDFDADGDGLVTEAEIQAYGENRFAEVDTNGDGAVSLDEFTAQMAARATERATQMFERLDVDGDGVLSRDALEARRDRTPSAARMIARLDTDDDGAISAEEFEAFKDRRADHGKRRGGKDHRRN